MLKILHFADAHIDMANYGRHDPESGLPIRVTDFLKSLDTIVQAAIDEQVDLVLFAGDAYKDRNPAPTFQREWERRIVQLSKAEIPTLLLVGNHDLSPSIGRANAVEEFNTLEVPHVRVIDRPALLTPDALEGLPIQILALPWISRSGLITHLGVRAADPAQLYEELEARLTKLVKGWLEQVDPSLPSVLLAHASVQGAKYGGERTVMLGNDLVLPGSLVKDPRLDYVALGHIHKPQDLNENGDPHVVYPGSIERVDFGEAKDDKFYVIANVACEGTTFEWRQIKGIRPFIDRYLRVNTRADLEKILGSLPDADILQGAIVRLTLEYPRDWEAMIDEAALREITEDAFEFHLVKRPQIESRIRLPEDRSVGSMTSMDLLEIYWRANHVGSEDREELGQLAQNIMQEVNREAQNG
jgi:exonuclease SbcD